MKLHALSSPEELLEKVDVLCIPASKEKAESIYKDWLTRLIHTDALPHLPEFLAIKANPAVFFGQWKGHRIKIVYWSEAEKLTEANAYSLGKKMAIKIRTECSGTSGLWVSHLNTPELIQSTFAGWTAGQYDLGLYKQADQGNHKSPAAEIYSFIPAGINERVATDGITIGLVQQEVMNLRPTSGHGLRGVLLSMGIQQRSWTSKTSPPWACMPCLPSIEAVSSLQFVWSLITGILKQHKRLFLSARASSLIPVVFRSRIRKTCTI
jgi:hypothetical protein